MGIFANTARPEADIAVAVCQEIGQLGNRGNEDEEMLAFLAILVGLRLT